MNIDKYLEFIIFSLYLIFIFLSVQIMFLWKDIDKTELKSTIFVNESLFKKSSIYIFSFSTFLMIHEFEFVDVRYSGIFDMLALICIVLFTYSWYTTLKPYATGKSFPREFKPY